MYLKHFLLTKVQNGPVRFEKTQHTKNIIHSSQNDNFVSRGLQRINRKIGKTVTLYHQELFKK